MPLAESKGTSTSMILVLVLFQNIDRKAGFRRFNTM